MLIYAINEENAGKTDSTGHPSSVIGPLAVRSRGHRYSVTDSGGDYRIQTSKNNPGSDIMKFIPLATGAPFSGLKSREYMYYLFNVAEFKFF